MGVKVETDPRINVFDNGDWIDFKTYVDADGALVLEGIDDCNVMGIDKDNIRPWLDALNKRFPAPKPKRVYRRKK